MSLLRATSAGCVGFLQTYLSIAIAVDDRHKETLETKKHVSMLTIHENHSTNVLCQNVYVEKLLIPSENYIHLLMFTNP